MLFCVAGVALHSPLSALHFKLTLYTQHSRLYTPHFTLHTSPFTLRTPHSTLYAGLHFFCFIFWCVLVFFPFFLRFRKCSRFFLIIFRRLCRRYPFLFPGFCRVLLGCIDLWLIVFDFPPAVFSGFCSWSVNGFHRCQQEFHCKFPWLLLFALSSMVCGHWSYSCVICLHSLGPFFVCFFGSQGGFRSTKNAWRLRLQKSCCQISAWISSLKTSYCYKTVFYIVNYIVVAGNGTWSSKQKVIQ